MTHDTEVLDLEADAQKDRLEELANSPDLIETESECQIVIDYLEDIVADISAKIEVCAIEHPNLRDGDESFLWKKRALSALFHNKKKVHRVKIRKADLFKARKSDAANAREVKKEENKAKIALADSEKAKAKAKKVADQLEIVKVASERSVHKRVCILFREKYGEDAHNELFDQAKAELGKGKSR